MLRFSKWDIFIESKKVPLGGTIIINGRERAMLNSNNIPIAKDTDSLVKFYTWFGESIATDSQNRPMVFYHATNSIFDIFTPGRFGKMGAGIYFTSRSKELNIHRRDYEHKYECYLRLEAPMILETPFSTINDDKHDGIWARRGQEGEEIKVYTSSQIKSTMNDGSWDVNNDNIYS